MQRAGSFRVKEIEGSFHYPLILALFVEIEDLLAGKRASLHNRAEDTKKRRKKAERQRRDAKTQEQRAGSASSQPVASSQRYEPAIQQESHCEERGGRLSMLESCL